ncbi:protein of unknown function [Xenorhabdus nematophila AN6/1]|nr:protein of unknown function [Xenorhabdus nematophila AN6/1]
MLFADNLEASVKISPPDAYYHERDQVIASMEITSYPTHRTC